jgi:coenzyme F420-reducing hydrogenase beta subunit
VVFFGTPCQIAGLRSYLGKDYEALICLDIICHGVPSLKVWQRYKLHMEEMYQAKAQRITFRRKNCGWKLYSVSLSFDNDTEYSQKLTEDIFMQGFLRNIYLRPSCYAYSFKTLNRQSDITLADFWGIEKILPSFDDDKCTSLILVNSKKGKEMFLSIADKMDYEKVEINQAILYNTSAVKSVDYNSKRDQFFQELSGSVDISQLVAKYTKVSFLKKLYMKVRTLLSRIKRKILS